MIRLHKNLLVAIDGSRMAKTVIDKAVEEASLKHASLTIVRVLETPQYLWNTPRALRIMEQTKKYLETELKELKETLSEQFPSDQIFTFVEEGNPKQKILELAEQRKPVIDLIVIGATGESEEQFTGSTATYIINLAHCDVLIVRE